MGSLVSALVHIATRHVLLDGGRYPLPVDASLFAGRDVIDLELPVGEMSDDSRSVSHASAGREIDGGRNGRGLGVVHDGTSSVIELSNEELDDWSDVSCRVVVRQNLWYLPDIRQVANKIENLSSTHGGGRRNDPVHILLGQTNHVLGVRHREVRSSDYSEGTSDGIGGHRLEVEGRVPILDEHWDTSCYVDCCLAPYSRYGARKVTHSCRE